MQTTNIVGMAVNYHFPETNKQTNQIYQSASVYFASYLLLQAGGKASDYFNVQLFQ